jgi:hypothetical protein
MPGTSGTSGSIAGPESILSPCEFTTLMRTWAYFGALPWDLVTTLITETGPRDVLGSLRLLVRPETMLRWHRDLIARRHARISRPTRAGRHEPSGRSAGWS